MTYRIIDRKGKVKQAGLESRRDALIHVRRTIRQEDWRDYRIEEEESKRENERR